MELADKTVKFRFKDSDEVNSWKSSLTAWKDFAIDFGSFAPCTCVEVTGAYLHGEDTDDDSVDYSRQLDELVIPQVASDEKSIVRTRNVPTVQENFVDLPEMIEG